MVYTDTHIIALHYRRNWGQEIVTFIQIFIIPPDGSSVQGANPVLGLTHEGFANCYPLNVEIAMKPSVDPLTGATHIRLLGHFSTSDVLKVPCIDLMLPKSSGLKVLPMTVDIHHISIPKEGVKSSRYVGRYQHLELCDDRLLRGFYWERHMDNRYYTMKFTIDTSQDPWAIACGQMARTERTTDIVGMSTMFDGLRGRLCYVGPEILIKDQIVVADVE
jgi:hypothetical protein